MNSLRLNSLVTLLCLFAGMAHAQSLQQRGFEPVDQLRDDVDPLSNSLRRTGPGLATTGERQNVFRNSSTTNDRLYYIAKGVMAEFDRSDYAFTRRGGILQLAPPNLVYRIDDPAKTSPGKKVVLSDRLVDTRVDGRVTTSPHTMPQTMIGFKVKPVTDMAPATTIQRKQRSTWEMYHYLSTVKRMLVLGAVSRVIAEQ